MNTQETYVKNYRLKMGNAIKMEREKKGLSQDELAEKMNVNRSTISKIENGKFSFSIDYLAKFFWHLGVEFELKEN